MDFIFVELDAEAGPVGNDDLELLEAEGLGDEIFDQDSRAEMLSPPFELRQRREGGKMGCRADAALEQARFISNRPPLLTSFSE